MKSCMQKGRTVTAVHKLRHTVRVWAIVFLAGFMISAYSTLSQAQEQDQGQTHQMSLTHHEFEAWTFTPRAKDQIVITNRSDISHSIYVTYPDGTVENLGVQLPGATVTWQVPDTGDYLFQCWIHPIIRAHMTVKEPIEVPATVPVIGDG